MAGALMNKCVRAPQFWNIFFTHLTQYHDRREARRMIAQDRSTIENENRAKVAEALTGLDIGWEIAHGKRSAIEGAGPRDITIKYQLAENVFDILDIEELSDNALLFLFDRYVTADKGIESGYRPMPGTRDCYGNC
jgi:hypothetical protein